MKTASVFLFLTIVLFIYVSARQSRDLKGGEGGKVEMRVNNSGDAFCLTNPKVMDSVLHPTRADTLNFEKLKERYKNSARLHYLEYAAIGLSRGYFDTSLFRASHFNRFKSLENGDKILMARMALVFEGQIVEWVNEDTAAGSPDRRFYTNYVIRIDSIFKSLYPGLKKGDKVLAKGIWGFYYYPYAEVPGVGHLTVSHTHFPDGRKQMFMLDKYIYEAYYYEKEKGMPNRNSLGSYCPSAFTLDLWCLDLMWKYEHNPALKAEALEYLRNDKKLDTYEKTDSSTAK